MFREQTGAYSGADEQTCAAKGVKLQRQRFVIELVNFVEFELDLLALSGERGGGVNRILICVKVFGSGSGNYNEKAIMQYLLRTYHLGATEVRAQNERGRLRFFHDAPYCRDCSIERKFRIPAIPPARISNMG